MNRVTASKQRVTRAAMSQIKAPRPIDPARKYCLRPFGLSLSKPCCNALRQAQGERKSELFVGRINNQFPAPNKDGTT
jgi:hypothetical protein